MTTQPRTCAACGRDLRGKWAGQRLGQQVLCLTCNAAGWNLVKGGPPRPPKETPAP